MPDEVIREGFTRQRRNLLLISFVLFIQKYLGVDLETINILGNKFKIKDPSSINDIMLGIFFYLLLRCFQYLYDLGDLGFRTHFFSFRKDYYKKIAKVIYNKTSGEKISTKINIAEVRVMRQDFNSVEVELGLNFPDEDNAFGFGENPEIKINFLHLILPSLKSIFKIIFCTRLFSEYIFPLLVAFGVIIYYFFKPCLFQ